MNFCKDCAHLLGNRNNIQVAESWRCGAPGNVIETTANPVTGEPILKLHAGNCNAARHLESYCGTEGKWFEKYEKPPVTIPKKDIERLNVNLEGLDLDL